MNQSEYNMGVGDRALRRPELPGNLGRFVFVRLSTLLLIILLHSSTSSTLPAVIEQMLWNAVQADFVRNRWGNAFE